MASFICNESSESSVTWTNFWNKEVIQWGQVNISAHPVEHVCPTLHSDALEHSQDGKEDVVEVGDSAVWPLPLAPALSSIVNTKASRPGESTRWRVVLHHKTWGGEQKVRQEQIRSTLNPPDILTTHLSSVLTVLTQSFSCFCFYPKFCSWDSNFL